MMIEQHQLTPTNHHHSATVRSIMHWVCLCLVPGIVCYTWFFGVGVLIQCLLAIVFAFMIEAVCLKLRKQDLRLFLCDGSVIVTAVLFALLISPYTPWWINCIGITFGLIFAKQIYGGLGHNLFNPAVVAFAFIILCFPGYMDQRPYTLDQPHSKESINTTLTKIFPPTDTLTEDKSFDAANGATPLTELQRNISSTETLNHDSPSIQNGIGRINTWEWISLFYLLGGIVLLVKGIISWHIPVAILGSLFAISEVLNLYDPGLPPDGYFHLLSGSSVLAAFFVATDPVTSPTTPSGKLIFGTIIGILIYTIGTWGVYPDGIAFAILIANGMSPMLDDLFRPDVISESGKKPDTA